MWSFTLVSAILAPKLLVLAIPASNNRGISLDMVKRAGPVGSAGITSIQPAEEKWTINIGIGGQTLPIVVDTGSHDLWVESIQESQTGSNHPLYTPPAGAAPISGATWTAGFDDGSTAASGNAFYDKVTIGAATLTQQVVGAATAVTSVNNRRKSGIIGLSHASFQNNYPKDYSPKPRAVMWNLYNQLKVNGFTVDLRTDNTGTLDLGYVDPTKYTGAITYVNRDLNGNNWFIPVDGYSINGTAQSGPSASIGLVHVDTGAPLIRLPSAAVQNYYSHVDGAVLSGNSYVFPCSVVKDLPSLGLVFAGVRFEVPGSWMWASQSGSTCVGALQSKSDTGYSMVGDMFLRAVFAVFDMVGNNAQGRVGFAQKNLPARAPPN